MMIRAGLSRYCSFSNSIFWRFPILMSLMLLGGGVCEPGVQARQRTEDVNLDGGAQAEGYRSLWTENRTLGNKRFHLTPVKQHEKDNKVAASIGLFCIEGRVLSLRSQDACTVQLGTVQHRCRWEYEQYFEMLLGTLTYNYLWERMDNPCCKIFSNNLPSIEFVLFSLTKCEMTKWGLVFCQL